MAVSKAKKSEILENLKVLVKDAKSIGFTSNKGLSVDDITNIRVGLRETNSTITLAKKTLIKIAFKEVHNVEISDDLLPGQIAIVCSNDDAVAGLGKVNDYIKSKDGAEKMEWTGSFFEEAIMDADATKKIAAMPSRETLLGRLVGSMQSPLSGLARFFDAAAKELEEKGVDTVGKLEWAKEEAPAEEKVEEAPKAEVTTEPKTEEVPEVKAEEAKTETPAEEPKTEEK